MSFESDEIFDGIVAWDSLFHLKIDQHEQAFILIDGLLNEEGYLVFTHGGSQGKISGNMYGETFTYSSPGPDRIRQILKSMNYQIIEWNLDTTESNGYLSALVKKQLSKA